MSELKDEFEPLGLGGLARLLNLWEGLAERERKLMLLLGTRLLAGQKLHGKLTFQKKKWDTEAIEESLDQSIYMGLQLNDHVEAQIKGIAARAEAEVVGK